MNAYYFPLVLFVLWSPYVVTHLNAAQAPDAPQPSTASSSGPETVDTVEKIGVQGNWVKKRELLMKSHEINAQIQELAGQIEPIRKSFIDRYTEIDTILNDYYKNLGLEEGKLQELFDDVMQYLEKKRHKLVLELGTQKNETIDSEQQAKIDVIENSINESKQKLEQLKLDMKSIEDLDHSLTDRIKRVDETISTVNDDATRANNIIEELWSIVDHNKARDRYYELTNNILEKIKSFQTYLSSDLTQDFDTVIQTVKTQIQQTQATIKKLEDEGFLIKDRANRVQELKQKKIDLKQQDPAELTKQKEPATIPVQTKKTSSWYDWYKIAYDSIADFFTSIYKGWLRLVGVTTTSAPTQAPQPSTSIATMPTAPAQLTTPTIPQS